MIQSFESGDSSLLRRRELRATPRTQQTTFEKEWITILKMANVQASFFRHPCATV